MEYQINFGFHAFSVPSAVVDNLLRLANENHLKVLLYLLRNPDKYFSHAQIAAFLRIPEESVSEAFNFWSSVNILEEKSLEGKQLELLSIPEPEKPSESVPKPAVSTPKKLSDPFSNPNSFMPTFTSELITSSPELKKLIRKAEDYYRPYVNQVQANSLAWMLFYLELPEEVILTLLHYCSETNRMRQQYINKIAISWYEENIFTLEQAEAKVQELMEAFTYQNFIMHVFSLQATPTTSQIKFIEQWQKFGFSEELLKYARDLSVEATGKVNFKYIDSILTEWHENQVTELKVAEKKHDEYIQQYIRKKKKGRKKKTDFYDDDVKRQEMDELNEYSSLVNQFEEG